MPSLVPSVKKRKKKSNLNQEQVWPAQGLTYANEAEKGNKL
jgi:hypothetical protein